MQLQLYILICQYIIFCNKFKFLNTKPFVGNRISNVKKNECSFVISLISIKNEVGVDEKITHTCTGTLISRIHVLTTAHCMRNRDKYYIKVVVGSNDFRRGERYDILWWLTYDQWAIMNNITLRNKINDIANIRLIEEVPDSIMLPEISNVNVDLLYDKQVTSVGWGSTNDTYVDPILKSVKLKVLTNEDCVRKVSILANQTIFLNPSQSLCTIAEPFSLLTLGASGGPLLYEEKLVGINKGVIPGGYERNYPELINIHVALNHYMDFVRDILNITFV